jgi:mRNA-degrading endonuclease RelE of RelBE toxin-antitoxin system
MKSSVTKTFRKQLNDLSPSVQEQAAKVYALLQEDPYSRKPRPFKQSIN